MFNSKIAKQRERMGLVDMTQLTFSSSNNTHAGNNNDAQSTRDSKYAIHKLIYTMSKHDVEDSTTNGRLCEAKVRQSFCMLDQISMYGVCFWLCFWVVFLLMFLFRMYVFSIFPNFDVNMCKSIQRLECSESMVEIWKWKLGHLDGTLFRDIFGFIWY